MKTSSALRSRLTLAVLLTASLLILTAGKALADGAPAPQPPRAPQLKPDSSPTAQVHLDVAQTAVKQALGALIRATNVSHGGYVEKAMVEVNAAAVDLTQATAYLKAHPEANKLANGPAPAETSTIKPAVVPAATRAGRGARGGRGAAPQTNMLAAMDALNVALNEFINPAGSDYHGPIMGDLGGFRKKIMDDIGSANTDVLAGIAFVNGGGGAAPIPPLPPLPPPPASSRAGAGATAENEGKANLPNAMAGIALSAALSLGGLHVFRKK